jgi:anti-sigma regulatory factor (Ser/Thr protein kinase)
VKVTLDQQFDVRTLRLLRETVAAHASAAGMPDQRAVDVMLAVHELAANAVRHGGGTGRMRMQVTAAELICQVSDPGPDAHGAPVAGATPERPRPGGGVPVRPWPYEPGHGLWLVSQVADRVDVVSGPAGSKVTVAFALVPGNVPGGLLELTLPGNSRCSPRGRPRTGSRRGLR